MHDKQETTNFVSIDATRLCNHVNRSKFRRDALPLHGNPLPALLVPSVLPHLIIAPEHPFASISLEACRVVKEKEAKEANSQVNPLLRSRTLRELVCSFL